MTFMPAYRPLLLLLVTGVLLTSGNGCRRSLSLGPEVVDTNAAEEYTESPSGLQYRIRRIGSRVRPDPKSKVRVHYEGWLDDKTVFDSSYQMGMSASFVVDQVIPGWTEGLQYIGEGGMIELTIPPELAYGEKGQSPDIPPNATLHFRIELLKVE